ncbi:MAG: (R,R)-butanediol dehydrogenase [Anaerolineales bacterium]
MRAALLYGPRDIRVEEVPKPEPGPGEVVIRVRATGICGSDLHTYTGDRTVEYPQILGHEFAGDVVAVGEGVSGIAPGDRVTAEPNFSCGECLYCREGLVNLCVNRLGMAINWPGTLAEYAKVPARFVWRIPDTMSYRQGALVEPLMVGVHAVRRGRVRVGDTVAVMGCGAIGLLTVAAAKVAGARVFAVDIVPEKLEMARRLGAEAAFNGRDPDIVSQIRALTPAGQGPMVVFETAGVAATVQQALDLVRSGGRVVLVGLSTRPAQVVPMSVARREVEILGSFIYYAGEFEVGIRLIADGVVDAEAIVGLAVGLDETEAAFKAVESGAVAKAIVEP